MLILAAYLVGTVPTAQVIAGWAGHDPTREGSGNPGASNVYRVAGRRAGVAVFAVDAAKGAVPALVGLLVDGRGLGLACGVAAMLGHIFPVLRGFRGGKGVATFGGVAWVLYPVVSLVLVAVWLAVVRRFGKASLGSLVLAVLLPVGVAVRGRPWWEVAVVVAVGLVVVARHRDNIRRLLRREEQPLNG